MQSLKNASLARRSGRFAASARSAGGSNLEDQDFVNAPVSRRKAGYPKTYAASEGAIAGQGEAQFAELDGEALAQALDDTVEEAVVSSPVVTSLAMAADAQSKAISSLKAVQTSFREAISPPQAQSDQAQGNSDSSSAGCTSSQPPSSPEVLKQLAALQAQLEELTEKHDETVRALADATREVRQTTRSELAGQLQKAPLTSLPNGTILRWLKSTSRENHMAELQRETRPDGSPLRPRVALAPTPARHGGPMDRFVQRLNANTHASRQAADFDALEPRSAPPSRFTSTHAVEHKNRRFYSKSERRAISSADDIGAEQASQESHANVDRNGYEDDGFCAHDNDEEAVFTSDEESTDDDSCTTLSDAEDSDESEDEAARRSEVVAAMYQAAKQKSPVGSLFHPSATGAALAALREDDVVIKRPTPRSHMMETLMSNWLRSNLSKARLEPVCEFLRQLRMLPLEYAISVYYALSKRILPVCRSFYKFLFYCVERYLPDHVSTFAKAHRRSKGKREAQKKKKSSKPTTRAPAIRDITDIADATSRFFDEYRHYQRDHKGWEHKTVFECFTPSQASSFAAQSRHPEGQLASMEPEPFMDLWRSTFGLRSSAAVLAALRRVHFSGDITLPASWSSYHQRFVGVLHQSPTTKRPPASTLAEVFMENCGNSFIEEDVLAFVPTDHHVALQLVLDRLNDSGFVTSEGFRNPRPKRDNDRRPAGNPILPQRQRDFRPREEGALAPLLSRDRDQRDHVRTRDDGAASREHRHRDNRQSDQAPGTRDRSARTPSQRNAPASDLVCKRCGRNGHTEESCVCKHDRDGQRLPEVDPATYALRKKNAVALATARLQHVHAVQEADDNGSGSDTSDVEELAHRDADGADFDSAYAILFSSEDDAEDIAHHDAAVGCSVADVDVPAPSLLNCGDVESNPGPFRPSLPMKRMEMAACILAVSKASFTQSAFTHTITSAPVRTVIPPSMALFMTMAIAAGFFAKILWDVCATFCAQHSSVPPSVSVSQVPRAYGFLHLRAGPPPYRTVGMLPCSHVGAPPNFPGGDSAAVTAGMRQKKSWLLIHIALVSISVFVLSFLIPQIGFSVPSLPPALSLLQCGDVEANPGPKANGTASTATVADDASSLPHPAMSPRADNAAHAGAGELRDYFATPATAPKLNRSQGSNTGGTIPPVRPMILAPIVAALPPSAPDFDASDNDAPPIQLPSHRARSRRREHTDTHYGMPALVSDSESSESDDAEPAVAYAKSSRGSPQAANTHALPALVTDSSDSASDDTPARRHIPATNVQPSASSNADAHIAAFLDAMDSSNSDTSDVEAEARAAIHPAICSARPIKDTLLPPPRFIGFVMPPSMQGPPPASHAINCAVDTMCQGSHSIISEKLALQFRLPLKPFAKTCRTANGALVTCSHVAEFNLVIRICGAWTTFPVSALVWKDAVEPLLLHNKLALDTGLTDFCAPNDVRAAMFGRTAFTTTWQKDIDTAEARALAVYHDDFMPEEYDDLVDLSAPLRCGDQDISTLPPSALEYAKRFPQMTRAIPRDAHPGLEKWRANINEHAIPLYSWPASDLKDLKEDKMPFKIVPKLHQEFDKLILMHYAESLSSCPTAVAMRAQLVQKTKTEVRFCVNGSTQKKVMHVGVYPMPHIRQILDFVAAFPWRAKIDMKHGYHNFEVHPDDRKWTTTIGGGRAIAWRKLVQGFASSGAFFQYAVCQLLGDRVWRICAVYLDDIIVVGKTEAECNANVLDIMMVFDKFRFRINFAKCAFVPSPDIDFLGCSLRGTIVLPGPKVSTMLAKIRPPHEQLTPKGQRHHLHVFLGCCAFIMQHCPGLKQDLAPLYIAVASEPYTYGERERRAFETAMSKLANLQPYHLPSHDPSYIVEVFTDASGGTGANNPGAWAAALGQRAGTFDVNNVARGFELLQLDGGVFNSRQADWNILKKEAGALFFAMSRFRPFIFGRRVRVFVDSKVLLHMFRSECPVLRRWYAYIQAFDFEMIHIASESNALVDCLSRCVITPIPKPISTPKLLKAAKLVPAPPITLGGDVETQPGPHFPVAPWAPILVVPAPSLLLDGDVEPNPGPPKVTEPLTDLLPLSFASDSEDDALPQRPPPKSIIVIDSSPSSSSSSPPMVAPVASKRRSANIADARNPSPTVATPAPASELLEREQPGPDDDSEAAPQDSTAQAPHTSVDRPDDQPAAQQDLLPLTVKLLRTETDPGPYAFVTSLAEAMRREQDRCPHPRGLSIPFDALDVRSQVMWFLQSSARQPLSLLFGRSFHQSFMAEPQPLSFHSRPDTRTPDTWEEYCSLMADPDTMPDLLFLQAACVTYGVQLVIMTETLRLLHISPSNAFRRIFLFCTERIHWSWSVVLTDEEAEALGDGAITVHFAAPALHNNAAFGPSPSLSNSLDIGDERLRLIHATHNAYTGHPGVEATVRQLIANGHRWRRMTAHVAQFIKRCPTCTSSRIKLQQIPSSASSIRLHARPLSRWHIDCSGSMGACAFTGFNILIVFVCEVTQFTALFGSRHGTALETAIALISLMGWLGLPESIHSDGGSENDNYIWHQVEQITGIKHTLSIPHVPNSDGIAERNVQTAKRFIRLLTVDLDKHNAWGLLLPIAQKGINDLKREQLHWLSPNEIVFASLADPLKFVIPTFYSRPLNGADLADVNSPSYQISANFAHRAACFQQLICNSVHDVHQRALTTSAARNPTACQDIYAGQSVLIDWDGGTPPTPTHPLKRGPYKVLDVHHNSISLEHLAFPPPADQARTLQWSKFAHVYRYEEDVAPVRSVMDPGASQVPTGVPTRNIDCVLSHHLITSRVGSSHEAPRSHVSRHHYYCRLYVVGSTRLPPRTASSVRFTYAEIAHTHAFDVYFASQRELTGHTPAAFMPANWAPHAVPVSQRPAHAAVPPHEHSFGVNADEGQYSQ